MPDPCQSILDAIDALQLEIDNLGSNEPEPTGVERTILLVRRKALDQQMKAEQQALERCRKSPPVFVAPRPPIITTFTGTITIATDNGNAPGPFTSSISFTMFFSADLRHVWTQDIDTNVRAVHVVTAEERIGQFAPETGAVSLPAKFKITAPIAGDFTADFPPPGLTTEAGTPAGRYTPHGVRLDPNTGALALAAATTIGDNISVNGTHLQVLLAGVVQPIPTTTT